MPTSLTTDLLQEGLALQRRGVAAEAAARYAQVLQEDPSNADAHYYLGVLACQSGRFADGVEHARKSLAKDPHHVRAHALLGRALSVLGRPEEALASFDSAIKLAPQLAQVYGHRADVLSELGRYAEAVDSYDRALELEPDCAEDWFNRGAALVELARHEEAIASFDLAIATKPDLAQAHLRRAQALSHLGRESEALEGLDRLHAIQPNFAEGWLGRGNVLSKLKRRQEALAAYERALALKPDFAEAWFGRGDIHFVLQHFEAACADYGKALELKPDLYQPAIFRPLCKLYLCDWENLQWEVARALAVMGDLRTGGAYPVLALPMSPAEQLGCARRYVGGQARFTPVWRGEKYGHERIRVAYLSADFREHPIGYLTAGLFERHDRSRFEITRLSIGADDGSPLRRRIGQAFEHFVDVRDQSDQEIADLIRRHEIDVVVDLMGFTSNNRLNVLARRPAPVQVNYLGYSGTMGADYVDYILADSTVIPGDHFEFFSEKVVWLPESFMVNDADRRIAERTPTRGECGLPEGAFVFCCFNEPYKITPEMFKIWMALLCAIPNSVLWLKGHSPAAVANLCREAEKSGVAPARLIFAPKVPALSDHLARHRQADLFLDTLPYNAHTTASDALWAGLPVVTCLGSTFAGRVAASLLKAAGLDELIVTSLEDYEALALRLARDPVLLASLKAKLARHRDACPLFDTDRFRRHIEQAYATMVEIWRRGENPRSFNVQPT